MAITKKQLEEQNTALRKENEKLHKQIDARVEESGAYQALKAQIANKISKKKGTYKRQTENWKNQYFELQAKYSDLSKQLKAKQAELDTSVTAQNALKSDLDKLTAEYTQATRHNARNAGRKPKLTADQEQEIKNLRSEGLNVRQIAAKMSCSTGLVCKILKNCINS